MAEGGGLLNRYTVNSRIGGSNPPPSASFVRTDSNAMHGKHSLLAKAITL